MAGIGGDAGSGALEFSIGRCLKRIEFSLRSPKPGWLQDGVAGIIGNLLAIRIDPRESSA